MKLVTTIILFLFSLSLFAQTVATGIVKDSQTNTPIPYVNIGIVKKDKGTVSSGEGRFKFEIPSVFMNDTIKLSSIGYQPKSVVAKDFIAVLQTNKTITLLPEITELNEVVVTNKIWKEKVVGNKTKSKQFTSGFGNGVAIPGCEIGINIKVKSPIYIKKFHANITSNTDEQVKFRMNFYTIKDRLPHKKIVNKNIIFAINVKEGDFTLDLEEYNIVIEEDFFVTMELMDTQTVDEEVVFSSKLLGNTMAYRFTSQSSWIKSNTIGIGFNFTVNY